MPELQIDQLATLLAAATLLFYPATIGLRALNESGALSLVTSSSNVERGFNICMPEPTDLDTQWQQIADKITSSLEQSRQMMLLQDHAQRELDGSEYLLERLLEDIPMVADICAGRSASNTLH